jgi:hypothetical protein
MDMALTFGFLTSVLDLKAIGLVDVCCAGNGIAGRRGKKAHG